MKNDNNKVGLILKVILNVILTFFVAIGILVLALYLFGIKPYVVVSGSMEPTIKTGSISFINTKIDYSKIEVGDIIAFKTESGIFATHRVVDISHEGFQTKGDANVDSEKVKIENYVGKNILSIPTLGYVVQATQTPRGKIILITLIVFILACAFLVAKPEKK